MTARECRERKIYLNHESTRMNTKGDRCEKSEGRNPCVCATLRRDKKENGNPITVLRVTCYVLTTVFNCEGAKCKKWESTRFRRAVESTQRRRERKVSQRMQSGI